MKYFPYTSAAFGGKSPNRFKMATITFEELEEEFSVFGVDVGDLMIIEKCELPYTLG